MWQNWESCAKPVYSFPNYIVSQTPWAVDSIALKCVHAFPPIQKALSLPCIFNSNQPLSTGRILFKGPVSDTGALSWDRRHPNCYFTVTLKRECSRWVQSFPGPAQYLIFLGQKVVGVSLQFHEMPFELIYLYGAVIRNKTREESYWRNGEMLSPGWVVFQKRIN